LRPDPQGYREHPVRIGKKRCVEDSMSNFKRNEGISHPFKTPVRDKVEILRCRFKCGKAVTEMIRGPEIEFYMAIRADEEPIRFVQ